MLFKIKRLLAFCVLMFVFVACVRVLIQRIHGRLFIRFGTARNLRFIFICELL